jgi:hypothetical protein
MSVAQRNIVDAIGTEAASGDVVMTIADHLDWSEPAVHLRALQDKVNDYLNFLDSGENEISYPASVGRNIRINVVFLHSPPTGEVEDYLARIRTIVRDFGRDITYETPRQNA